MPKYTILLEAIVLKFAPEIVTTVPIGPDVGVKELMIGGGINVNPERDAVPPGVETFTLPELPILTSAVILVDELTTKLLTANPPKLTLVVPIKLAPVILIIVPTIPLVGVKELMVGAGIKTNPDFIPVPKLLVILTLPEAPLPTTAVIVVELIIVNDAAATPPKLTAVDPAKFCPDIVIVVPWPAFVGVNELIIGNGRCVNPDSDPVP